MQRFLLLGSGVLSNTPMTEKMMPLLLWGLWDTQWGGNWFYCWLTHVPQHKLNFLGCTCQKGQKLGLLLMAVPEFHCPASPVEVPKVFTTQSKIRSRVGDSRNTIRDVAPPALHLHVGQALPQLYQSYLPPLSIPPGPGKSCSSLQVCCPAEFTIQFRKHKLVLLA